MIYSRLGSGESNDPGGSGRGTAIARTRRGSLPLYRLGLVALRERHSLKNRHSLAMQRMFNPIVVRPLRYANEATAGGKPDRGSHGRFQCRVAFAHQSRSTPVRRNSDAYGIPNPKRPGRHVPRHKFSPRRSAARGFPKVCPQVCPRQVFGSFCSRRFSPESLISLASPDGFEPSTL